MLNQASSCESWADVPWLRERLSEGLELLGVASRYAALDGSDVKQFAVNYSTLCERGITECDLLWLKSQAFVEHFIEQTLPGDPTRSFRQGGAAICTESCFALTSEGFAFLEQLMLRVSCSVTPLERPRLAPDPEGGVKNRPSWNADRQELWYLGRLVKRFRLPSPNQAAILCAFEEDDWPARIDDPLPPKAEQDPKRRLHDTIRNLNRAQAQPLLRFVGDGSGQGVLWEAID